MKLQHSVLNHNMQTFMCKINISVLTWQLILQFNRADGCHTEKETFGHVTTVIPMCVNYRTKCKIAY